MKLEQLKAGVRVLGVIPGEPVEVLAVSTHGVDAAEVTFKRLDGGLAQQVLYRSDEERVEIADSGSRPFDADAAEFRLAAEAQRIQLAGLFDPMLAIATSDVQPLPHQIRAVYGELLPRTPLRFLLADDPGAGKTIMAGLYIKELLLRDDVKRCLVVAPGGLVEQWQDELRFKFGLDFRLLTNQDIDAAVGHSAFDTHPLLIARMDQLARHEDLQRQLTEVEWDLVVVDEAHRMGAHYFGVKLEKTKRFQLGELLRDHSRHLLLMTATPHSGKEEDFQLFLTLLDPDRFTGRFRRGVSSGDVSGLMRRMVKEELLTFDGKPLFPERIAQTVPYTLSDAEQELYELVTEYVREGMNRADKVGGKRRTTVGFALTVLQRRLASSPAAIHQSLVRRSDRLQRRRDDIAAGKGVVDYHTADVDISGWDDDDISASELEDIEEELLDSATAALTVAELEAELEDLRRLIAVAQRVRESGTDKKWNELRSILEDTTLVRIDRSAPRKLIVFTEHRDTLDYLTTRIRSLLGRPGAVEAIHGGVRRAERRRVTEEFTKNPLCQVLVATDAAGEGLNLQAAHLMVNYDLPWNPNRIEQRFGRIHRIGQADVCRLWNLVARGTREGQVFEQLLAKVEEQRKAYGGKVFDVLGAAFDETPLRELLLEAIRYGDKPETKLKMSLTINVNIGQGLKELLEERALARETLSELEVAQMRQRMDEAAARRLQPHYVEWAFRNAFQRLGGRLARRERGRFEISNVPASLRNTTTSGPIATRYERVTFDLPTMDVADKPRADLLAPGHPLHDTVISRTIGELREVLERGTILISAAVEEPTLLVGVREEVVDATTEVVGRRFGYAYVAQDGTVTAAGPAPYLDCVAAPPGPVVDQARSATWMADAEARAVSWIIAYQLPEYLAEIRPRRGAELAKAREQVGLRLSQEINRLAGEALVAREKEIAGHKPKEGSDSLTRKSEDLAERLKQRLALLDRQAQMSTTPPQVVTAALVLPLAALEAELPAAAPMHAVETKEVERRGVDKVLSIERSLGREPVEQPFTNPGYDILSRRPDGSSLRIEVKARIAGADDFFVTHNEVITGKNAVPHYRLALVTVHPDGPGHDEVRYLADPFASVELGGSDVTGCRLDWVKTWAKGHKPF